MLKGGDVVGRTFAYGGIHPEYNKHLSRDKKIEVFDLVDEYYVPMQQHIGKPARCLVKKGDKVEVGQKIGEADGFISANIHAPVTGTVVDVVRWPTPVGFEVETVVIERDKAYKGEMQLRDRNWRTLAVKELLEIVKEAGIVGLGGATFPTHVKLAPQDHVDVLLLNGAECEPYLTCDHRIMVERAEDIVTGAQIMAKILGVERIIIGVEDNKPDAIDALRHASLKIPSIKVVELETAYPQGAEKQLIYACTGRVVPKGALPSKAGVVVNNVGTALAVFEAVVFGKPLIERVVTVTGKVGMPANLLIRIGTPFEKVLKVAEIATETPKIISGGPMMGIAQSTLSVPVVKGTSGILVLDEGEAANWEEWNDCLNCAACIDACPMNLLPSVFSRGVELGKIEDLRKLDVMSCIECGCCSYVCPAGRPIVQFIRVAKAILRRG